MSDEMTVEQPAERRAHIRRKTFLGGTVSNEAITRFSCIVRDLTVDGARVECAANRWLPDTFRFSIPAKHCQLRGRVVWRNGNMVGVYFDGFELGAIEELSGVAQPTDASLPN